MELTTPSSNIKKTDEMHLADIRDNLLTLIDRNPLEAKLLYGNVIHTLLLGYAADARQLAAEVLAEEEEQAVLLAWNAELIDTLKRKGLDLPNMDEIARDARARLKKKRQEIVLGIDVSAPGT